MNLGHKYTLKPGFHRLGNRYGHLIKDKRLLGRNPLDDLQLTKSRVPVNILANENYFELEIPVPGYRKEDLTIEIDSHVLTIKGEITSRKDRPDTTLVRSEHNFTSFERSFELDKSVDEDKIAAHAENGMLIIRLNRTIKESEQPANIEVE
jgi:HSP20 family protein